MKLKSWVALLCLSVLSSAFAGEVRLHPKAAQEGNQSTQKGMVWPGACEIEIANQSRQDVVVFGAYDDGMTLQPFRMYGFDTVRVSLFYYGYCHAGMNLYIDTVSGYNVYAGYTPVDSTIYVVPYLAKQLKAEVRAKA